MFTDTRKAVVIVAMAVATGVAGAAMTCSAAQAETVPVPGTVDYAAARVAAAFEVAATMPPVAEVRVPFAVKGDLPVPSDCLGLSTDDQAECMDVAYEVPSESIIMESRFGNTSTLTRMESMTLADFADEEEENAAE